MRHKPFNNHLDNLLYSDSKYDAYALDKSLDKVAKSDWGTGSHDNSNYSQSTYTDKRHIEKYIGEDEKVFDDKYLSIREKQLGYTLSPTRKLNDFSNSTPSSAYTYNQTALTKIYNSWDDKSFWYKFLVVDLVIGALFELFLHYGT